jgi:hypothetical protein
MWDVVENIYLSIIWVFRKRERFAVGLLRQCLSLVLAHFHWSGLEMFIICNEYACILYMHMEELRSIVPEIDLHKNYGIWHRSWS